MNSLNDFEPNDRICIYGAGEIGISLMKLIEMSRPDVTIVCFWTH